MVSFASTFDCIPACARPPSVIFPFVVMNGLSKVDPFLLGPRDGSIFCMHWEAKTQLGHKAEAAFWVARSRSTATFLIIS
jgi:hypothetical protein